MSWTLGLYTNDVYYPHPTYPSTQTPKALFQAENHIAIYQQQSTTNPSIKCQCKSRIPSLFPEVLIRVASSLTNERKLQGSCQCGGVEFILDSQTPVPYQLCACSICRKVGGYGGSVNLGGIAKSLDVKRGKELIKYVFIAQAD